MREIIKDKGRLEHILKAMEYIIDFTKDVSFDIFVSNPMLRFAVIKNIEIIGEACYMLSSEFKNKYPEVEWAAIIKMRHILVHGYYQIEDEIAWAVVQKDLQPLKEKIIKIYNKENTH